MSNTHSENTKRIAKNTMMLYGRMLFSMVVSLYTTRIILKVLGEEDYGILNLVGAIIGMTGILTSLLSVGTNRFITFALGKGNEDELKNTFSASLTIHLILGIIIFILGETFGITFVNNLNINPDRLSAAHFVFQLSLLATIISIIQSPYYGTIIAHEKMSVYAYISIWDTVAKLLIVYFLTAIEIDKLKLYISLLFAVTLSTAFIYYIFCRKQFAECRRFSFRFDKELYKEILRYSGWNTISVISSTLNNQGITVLLNNFGMSVIASRGIAASVSGFIYKFVSSFQSATRPQIIKFCAVKDFSNMNALILRTSKFSSYLIGIIGIPLFIKMEYVLQLWLDDVPTFTTIFARFTLIQGLIQAIDSPVGSGIHAIGKMRLPNITSSVIYISILPISYLAIRLGASPIITYIISICIYPLALFMDIYILNMYSNFPIKSFIKATSSTLLIILVTTLCAYGFSLYHSSSSFMGLVLTTIVSCLIFILLVYFWGLTKSERFFVNREFTRRICFYRKD